MLKESWLWLTAPFHLSTPIISRPQYQTAVHPQHQTHPYGHLCECKRALLNDGSKHKSEHHITHKLQLQTYYALRSASICPNLFLSPPFVVVVVATGGPPLICVNPPHTAQHISYTTPHPIMASHRGSFGLVILKALSKTDRQPNKLTGSSYYNNKPIKDAWWGSSGMILT